MGGIGKCCRYNITSYSIKLVDYIRFYKFVLWHEKNNYWSKANGSGAARALY
jgi:hypothetical protein